MDRKKIYDSTTDNLYDAILSLKTKEDIFNFFEDLCTIKEIKEMSKRLEAARLLNNNENYEDVSKKLSISSATLSRINKCLLYGSGGYKKVLNNLKGGK